ncbi:DUF1919 domain-containing protein [Aureibaculum marinum]|uniref:DUF1919 domain-containing protein n=1 Tax=Aureibaculum marinum TaxID=2487930 RepID=A0A3N4NPC9_9FLAO|nr:DUF1919 domain-containing protein [Aureibaculum marinum]RPD98222.1 DUF1919 domain-containing protein [Aureibaculum marinum]
MVKKIKVFAKRKTRKIFESFYSKKDIDRLGDKNFVIISNNCWGGEVYKWYKRPYNSPFIGLFLYGPCYLKLLSNFHYYIRKELKFVESSKYPDRPITYPLALLGDIEIHFTHYDSIDEARTKWTRRTSRMLEEKNFDNYYFKICDRERVTKKHLLDFHELPHKNKVSFALNDIPELLGKNHIKVNESQKNRNHVPNGKKMFKLTFLYFDLNSWLVG